MPLKPRPAFPQPAATVPARPTSSRGVVADLSDDTAKLVYADWLDERDDPRGQFLRDSVAAFRAERSYRPPGRHRNRGVTWSGSHCLRGSDCGVQDRAETFSASPDLRLRSRRPERRMKSYLSGQASSAVVPTSPRANPGRVGSVVRWRSWVN